MPLFQHAHATHPDWRMALSLALAQLDATAAGAAVPTLGWVYLTDHYAPQAEALFAELQQRRPGVAWVGAVGVGVAAGGAEYIDEPALALMLGALPPEQFRVFSGARPLGAGMPAHTAQVHADGGTPDIGELIREMSRTTLSGYLFGGLASARNRTVHIADGVHEGGLSGVAFGPDVALVSRVTQGAQPIGPVRIVTEVERNVVVRLDDEPALDCLLRDLGVDATEPRRALPALRQTQVGLTDARNDALARRGQFGTDTRVRHLVGIDPQKRSIAIADVAEPGMQLAFCRRDVEAARRDLVRICAEIREELEPEELTAEAALALGRRAEAAGGTAPAPGAARIAGAVYVSCAGRGGPYFGGPSAELAIVRRALGDVPLVGFFAGGEIAREHLYGYTGVLTVFSSD